jgi:hypothetical protein
VDIAGETLEEVHIKEGDQLEEDEEDIEDSSDEREQKEEGGQLIEAERENEGHFIEEEGQLAEAEQAEEGHLLEGDLDEEEGHLDVVNPMNERVGGGQLEEADESSQQIFLASHLALQMEVGEVRDGITNNKLERYLE